MPPFWKISSTRASATSSVGGKSHYGYGGYHERGEGSASSSSVRMSHWCAEMTCPACGLENPPGGGTRCDCGHEFSETPSVAPAQPAARPNTRVFYLLALLVIILFALRDELAEAFRGSNFRPAPSIEPITEYKPLERQCLVINSTSTSGSYDEHWTTIKGTVQNVCGDTFSFVSVKFQLTDASGAVVGNAIDSLTGLGPLQSWRFKALGPTAPKFGSGEVQGY